MSLKAVLFDFDGTVVDSSRIVIDSWQHTYRTLRGEEGDERTIKRTFGETLMDAMEAAFPEVPPHVSAGIYRDYQLAQPDHHWTLFPGMREMIQELKDRGYLVAIITSRLRDTTWKVLEYFDMGELFDAVVTCNDTDSHKPDPEPALIGMEKLGVSPEECIFVGDSRLDIGCGHNAGMPAVLVSWTVSVEEADKVGIFKPDYEMEKAEDLLDIVERC